MDPLTQLLAIKNRQLKEVKADLKNVKKSDSNYNKLKNRIVNLESYIARFKKMKPYKMGDIIIDYKMYENFMKKLKGFEITEQVIDNFLVVTYKKGANKGELQLNDLSDDFPKNSDFPEKMLQESR